MATPGSAADSDGTIVCGRDTVIQEQVNIQIRNDLHSMPVKAPITSSSAILVLEAIVETEAKNSRS